MALTATATMPTRSAVMRTLGKEECCKLVSICPAKANVMYSVCEFTSFDCIFGEICKLLKAKKYGCTQEVPH